MKNGTLVFAFLALFIFITGCKDDKTRRGTPTPPPPPPPPPPTTCIVLAGEEIPSSMWSCWPESMPPSLRPGQGGVKTLPILAPMPKLAPINTNQKNYLNYARQHSSQAMPPLAPLNNPCFVYMQWLSGIRLAYNSGQDFVTGASCAWKMDAAPAFANNGGAIAITVSISIDTPSTQSFNFIQTGLFTAADRNGLFAIFFVMTNNGSNIGKFGPLIPVSFGDFIETWIEFKEEKNNEFVWEAWCYNQNIRKEFYMGTLSLPSPGFSGIAEQEVEVLVDNIVFTEKTTVLPDATVTQGFADQTFEAAFSGLTDNQAYWVSQNKSTWFTPGYSKTNYVTFIYTLDCNTSSVDLNEPVNNAVNPLMGTPGRLTFKAGPGVSRTVQTGEFNWR